MADENRNPESHSGDEGSGAQDPIKDPLRQAEEVFEGVTDEEVEGTVEDADVVDAEAADAETAEVIDGDAVVAEERSTSDLEAELQADLQRVQAEYVNYRRRVERDRSVERERTVGQVLTALLPVLDDVYAARQAGDLTDGPFAAIANKLEKLLGEQGLEVIDEVGAAFDPSVHEAIIQQPHPEIAADHVAAVLRAGYRQNDRVLRAAQVMVSTGPAE
ncbi:nucleotide exchange factor GrpE [Nesterenkonia aerolata]|uniref:Protein GrpE n=1 Tax=Nesterenkonia aerolata TaxID=3074079 RepID=A0ABU2DRI2_9MICC|nr:nucleotide exchange factor GrpE [Nesterenkonia sp. LY-0111]MDR8019079.1 nucleotide exchange factor GrpE [Nesterenkonia sp. LY-0111]